MIKTRKGNSIVTLFVPQPRGAGAAKYTLLHSHGNAVSGRERPPWQAHGQLPEGRGGGQFHIPATWQALGDGPLVTLPPLLPPG